MLRPNNYRDGAQENFPGADITDDDLEFVKAMERYIRENKRPFPRFTEVLQVLKSLGWRKLKE